MTAKTGPSAKPTDPEAPAHSRAKAGYLPQEPAKRTAMHVQNVTFRDDNDQISPHKGFRRMDGLDWLLSHKAIAPYQHDAGRRLQEDWQASKIEVAPRSMSGGGGGNPTSALSDSKLDAQTRHKDAMAVIPQELVTLTVHFLHPEDHPYSLEQCAAIVRMDRKAASLGIRIALTLLARHYGLCG